MDWTYQYIIYRIQEGGQPEEVYHASLNKDVTYWLQYVAEVGDVLCLTPAHKRNPTDGPKYFSHKEKSGKTVRDENVLARIRQIERIFRELSQ